MLWNISTWPTFQSVNAAFFDFASCLGKTEFSVFISHVIKTKNRNRSINKLKNLGYDR